MRADRLRNGIRAAALVGALALGLAAMLALAPPAHAAAHAAAQLAGHPRPAHCPAAAARRLGPGSAEIEQRRRHRRRGLRLGTGSVGRVARFAQIPDQGDAVAGGYRLTA